MDVVQQLLGLFVSLLMLSLVIGVTLYPFVMLVDLLIRPRWQWRAIERSKAGWALIVFFGSIFGAIAYAGTVRRQLTEVEHAAATSSSTAPVMPGPTEDTQDTERPAVTIPTRSRPVAKVLLRSCLETSHLVVDSSAHP